MGLKSVLGSVHVYMALQRLVGSDGVRYRCIDELGLTAGQTLLDVGCGPAYYVPRLPAGVRYFGFDTSQRYIDWATRKFGGPDTRFHCELLTEQRLADLPKMDAVILMGLLHHLDDGDSRTVLDLVAKALAPGGQVVAIDTTYAPGQSRISRWMSDNDRGEHVRVPEGFVALARESFGRVDGEVADSPLATLWVMRMAEPVHPASVHPAPSATQPAIPTQPGPMRPAPAPTQP